MFFTLRTNMEWTNEHDIQLLIEMRASQLFTFKKGSPERGRIWDEITETLNSVRTLKFCIKDKRGVRDRWNLLQGRFRRKRRAEEGASGVEVEEPTPKDVLIEELCELEDAALQSVATKQQDKKAAEDTRRKAMERLGETKKRKKEEGELPEKKTRKSTTDAVGFLSEKMKLEQAFHQEELALKRKEQDILSQTQQHNQQQQQLLLQQMQEQNRRMQAMHEQSLQQQQQQNQMLMSLLQKLITR